MLFPFFFSYLFQPLWKWNTAGNTNPAKWVTQRSSCCRCVIQIYQTSIQSSVTVLFGQNVHFLSARASRLQTKLLLCHCKQIFLKTPKVDLKKNPKPNKSWWLSLYDHLNIYCPDMAVYMWRTEVKVNAGKHGREGQGGQLPGKAHIQKLSRSARTFHYSWLMWVRAAANMPLLNDIRRLGFGNKVQQCNIYWKHCSNSGCLYPLH